MHGVHVHERAPADSASNRALRRSRHIGIGGGGEIDRLDLQVRRQLEIVVLHWAVGATGAGTVLTGLTQAVSVATAVRANSHSEVRMDQRGQSRLIGSRPHDATSRTGNAVSSGEAVRSSPRSSRRVREVPSPRTPACSRATLARRRPRRGLASSSACPSEERGRRTAAVPRRAM